MTFYNIIMKKHRPKNLKYKNSWQPLELEILKKRWMNTEPSQWIHLLPDRTYLAIKTKANLLRLKRDLSQFSKKKTFRCIICGKRFEGYGNKILCSKKCVAKYQSQQRLGENNPNFKEDKFEKRICPNCGLEFRYPRSGLHIGQERTFCSLKCSHEYQIREKAPRWDGGIHSLPYSYYFDKKLKLKMKQRDGNKCVFCGRTKNLVVHHIDYDKMNYEENNLITLCRICHGFTNSNRDFWQFVFQFIMSDFEIVKKGWGFEFIPISNKDYCLKMLVFYPNKRFSDHYHLIKNESWYCLRGKLLGTFTNTEGEIKEIIFKKGDVVKNPVGLSHQLLAIEPSIIIEVSTHDDPTDSYRIKTGDQ